MKPILKRLYTEIPLLSAEAGAALLSDIDPQLAEHPAFKAMRERLRPQIRMEGEVAVVPIEGVLARKPDVFEMMFYGIEDVVGVQQVIDQAFSDDAVKAVVLDVNSPGGFLTGVPEVADAIRAGKSRKPTIAWTGGSMASAAYWIGSQASEIVATRSASVGSIGVYSAFLDTSEYLAQQGVKVDVLTNKEGDLKATGLPGTALSDGQRNHIRQRMDETFSDFKSAVLSQRKTIPADAMRGQSFIGDRARGVNLIDRLGDLSFAIALARAKLRGK